MNPTQSNPEKAHGSATFVWKIIIDDGYGGPFVFEILGARGDTSPHEVASVAATFLKGALRDSPNEPAH
jgi:predicted nucleic acid-binding protein